MKISPIIARLSVILPQFNLKKLKFEQAYLKSIVLSAKKNHKDKDKTIFHHWISAFLRVQLKFVFRIRLYIVL